MDIIKIEPQFGDTDMWQHIHYAAIIRWFERGRMHFYKIFNPDCSADKWNLILAHTECDYFGETRLSYEVEIRSTIERIGNTSFTIYQECWQKGVKTACCRTVLVFIDHQTKHPMPLTPEYRQALEAHLK